MTRQDELNEELRIQAEQSVRDIIEKNIIHGSTQKKKHEILKTSKDRLPKAVIHYVTEVKSLKLDHDVAELQNRQIDNNVRKLHQNNIK